MGQHDGGGAPAPQANGMPELAGRVEKQSGSKWVVLFPTGAAGTPASLVAAFPCEEAAQRSLHLLQLHALLCACPSLPLDRVPTALLWAIQVWRPLPSRLLLVLLRAPSQQPWAATDDDQCDEDSLAELRDTPIDELVNVLRQSAAGMAAATAADAAGEGVGSDGADAPGSAAAGAAVEPLAAQAHSTGSAALAPPSAAGPVAAAAGPAEELCQLPAPAAPVLQPSLLQQLQQPARGQQQQPQPQQQPGEQQHPQQQPQPQQAQGEQHPQQQEEQQAQGRQRPQQQLQQAQGQQHPKQQHPHQQGQGQVQQHPHQLEEQQPPAAPQQSNVTAVSGDAGASDYLGVRPAPGGCGGWLAEVSVLLGPAGQAEPGGRRHRQAVPVASELEAAFARDLALVWQEAWAGPSSPQPLCNFPFKRYCQDARLWAVLCELPCWRDLAAYLAQLQEDGSLLRAAQAYDAGSLPQGWPEPAAQPAGAAPPAAQHPANQQGDGEGDQGRGGSGPPRANGRAGGGGGRGGPSAAAGRGTKRKAGAPAAGDHGQWQPGRPIVSASGYPGVYRSRWGGWYGKMTPPGRRSACDLLSDHDVQVVAVGRQLALFWASLVSQGQHRPAPHPPLRDSFKADAELMRQLSTAKGDAEMRKIVRQLQRAGRLHEWRHLLPPPLASSCPQQQAQAEAPAAAAGQADSFAGASAAAAEAGAEAAGPAAGSAGSSAALAALAAVAAAARSSSPSTGALPAWPRKEGRPQGSPPASQGASKAAAPAAAGARVAAAPLPSGWEARAVAWQQLSQRQAEAWAGSLQAVSLDFLEGNWSGGQALAAAGPPPPPSRPPCSTGAAAAARNLPPAEEVAPPRTQQRVLLRPGGCDAPQQATVGQPGARLAAAGAALLPQGWQEQSVAWQQTSRHAAKRWEASVPPAVPSWLADDAQLHTMLLPDAGAQPAGPRWQQAVAPSAAGLAEPGAGVHSQRPPQQAAAAPGKLQHTAALAQPDQQPQQAQQPEGSATTACTLLQWQPAAQAACSQAAASAGAASLASPALLQPGAPLPPMATPPGSVLASLPAPAAASLQLLLARLPIERLPEVERGGGSAPPLLAHQQQQAPTAAGGDVLLYCRKTNGLAGLPLLERLLVVEARREGGPGPGSKASQQHCECLLLATGPSEDHMSPPEALPPGASSAAAAAALGRVALLSRGAFKQSAVAVRSVRQWRPVGRVPPQRFAEVLAALSHG